MKLKTLALAAAIAAVATAVVAHKGATGTLLERMNGMMAMGKAVKEIAPMMRSQTTYDADQTRALAAVLREHSGDAMLALFPEGMNDAPSVAKDEIWTNWDEFSTLAADLAIYARALDLAAENGVSATGVTMSDMMGAETSGMMGTGGSAMMGTNAIAPLAFEELAALPVNDLFARTARTCSACHATFRAEE